MVTLGITGECRSLQIGIKTVSPENHTNMKTKPSRLTVPIKSQLGISMLLFLSSVTFAVAAAPVVSSQPQATVSCDVPFTYSATVSDMDGDAVQATWMLNGVPVETDNIAAGGPPSSGVVAYTATLPDGVNTLSVTARDSSGNVTTSTSTITVADTTAPVIVAVTANPRVLWSPNHKMTPVRVNARVTDDCGTTTWKILSMRSNQAVDSKGSGKKTSPDWRITGDHTIQLRAERTGKGGSRVYVITVQATDEVGNLSAPSTVRVVVPHFRRGSKYYNKYEDLRDDVRGDLHGDLRDDLRDLRDDLRND